MFTCLVSRVVVSSAPDRWFGTDRGRGKTKKAPERSAASHTRFVPALTREMLTGGPDRDARVAPNQTATAPRACVPGAV